MMIISLYKVEGHSMEPTFTQGQTLLVSSIPYFFRKPKIGDVVVVKDPRDGRLLLKRIKKILKRVQDDSEEKYFVTGDNPKASRDSREFGEVSRKFILGKVVTAL